MTIDRPSLAALLAQKKSETTDNESKRPFVLKDPKAIVKELLSKKPKQDPPVDEDEAYLQSLLTEQEEPDAFQFEDLTPKEEPKDRKSLLKSIMENLKK